MTSNNDEDWIIRSEARKGTFRDYNGDWRDPEGIVQLSGNRIEFVPDIGTQYWNQGRTQEIKDRVLHVD